MHPTSDRNLTPDVAVIWQSCCSRASRVPAYDPSSGGAVRLVLSNRTPRREDRRWRACTSTNNTVATASGSTSTARAITGRSAKPPAVRVRRRRTPKQHSRASKRLSASCETASSQCPTVPTPLGSSSRAERKPGNRKRPPSERSKNSSIPRRLTRRPGQKRSARSKPTTSTASTSSDFSAGEHSCGR
jgi:hypothetical protein